MKKDEFTYKLMSVAPVIPVVTINNIAHAVPLARALVAGGLPSVEVTLRTPEAVEAIRLISEEVEGAIVGAGTVVSAVQIEEVERAGAAFMVSPGVSTHLLQAADQATIPLLPGASSASEVMELGERGYQYLKFFPAGAAGGVAFLKSLGAPLAQYKFCPTGGVNPVNAREYLNLANVLCVGGSWVAPSDLMENEDWESIENLARNAVDIGKQT